MLCVSSLAHIHYPHTFIPLCIVCIHFQLYRTRDQSQSSSDICCSQNGGGENATDTRATANRCIPSCWALVLLPCRLWSAHPKGCNRPSIHLNIRPAASLSLATHAFLRCFVLDTRKLYKETPEAVRGIALRLNRV